MKKVERKVDCATDAALGRDVRPWEAVEGDPGIVVVLDGCQLLSDHHDSSLRGAVEFGMGRAGAACSAL